MYDKILLAFDGSREGLVALREGALLARRFQAQIFLLSVLNPSALGASGPDGTYVDASNEMIEASNAMLERGVSAAKRLGLEPTARLMIGEPAAQIGAYAKEIGADLVVVGHRRQGLLERWWSGSSGAKVSDHVDCSVLIGRTVITDEAFRAELEPAASTNQLPEPG
jgi:nucleotide-binding universal stress UspA family protein